MDLCKVFNYSVERHPNKIAVVDGNKRYTYLELAREVDAVAFSLHSLGMKKSDRVAVLLKNRIEAVVLFWAIQKLGAIFAPINIRQSQEIVHYCLNDLEARFVIYGKVTENLINKNNFTERPLLINIDGNGGDINYHDLIRQPVGDFTPNQVKEDDLSVILYTSGTSGNPKGVPRSHQNEYSASFAHIFQCHYQWHDITLGVMSLNHTMGLRSLISMMMLNGTFVILRDYDPFDAVQLIEQEKINVLYLLPNMFHDIAALLETKRVHFDDLHSIVYAGAPMSPKLIHLCQQVFRPKYFVNHYGSTENYTFTFCDRVIEKPGSVGKPGIHQNIRIIDPDVNRTKSPNDTVPKGEIGEIIVHIGSPESFKGYWNKPESTKRSVKENWYYTGDLGYVDNDGDLFVVGRMDEMIIYAGEKIYPLEVESVLLEHPKVQEVVVTGEPDERWGNVLAAYIVPNDTSLTANELDLFCKRHPKLSNYKRPRKYIFQSSFPKTAGGKILRNKINSIQF
ncbi:class I adenylate-forming enzyme family protein [Bacillus sp. DTU_2020_1000418_1_SI_GHA_SEK_038]|uniref:class I adenylate-forming enzyme family protein n=1 Tax=Bacillus sp. DTU_2020_1000418_1_SI_GHA_SEK_038 TaxID=3077585 RepID=UPI0028E443A3|nr:class I adenylate-forming enzyme family protein [Bacillus sp. DTU_2020_1000418_1_SI_GHA_SEK_038]WNS73652.1 class I adenylate-forming enzyme family protein [Bacillus sp. DTU_2020_1000418_1_SI_GHA_SEK_038]